MQFLYELMRSTQKRRAMMPVITFGVRCVDLL